MWALRRVEHGVHSRRHPRFCRSKRHFIKSTLSKSEKTRELEMGKIALSGSQAITVLGRYPLRWPREAQTVFDIAGGLFWGKRGHQFHLFHGE